MCVRVYGKVWLKFRCRRHSTQCIIRSTYFIYCVGNTHNAYIFLRFTRFPDFFDTTYCMSQGKLREIGGGGWKREKVKGRITASKMRCTKAKGNTFDAQSTCITVWSICAVVNDCALIKWIWFSNGFSNHLDEKYPSRRFFLFFIFLSYLIRSTKTWYIIPFERAFCILPEPKPFSSVSFFLRAFFC